MMEINELCGWLVVPLFPLGGAPELLKTFFLQVCMIVCSVGIRHDGHSSFARSEGLLLISGGCNQSNYQRAWHIRQLCRFLLKNSGSGSTPLYWIRNLIAQYAAVGLMVCSSLVCFRVTARVFAPNNQNFAWTDRC